MRVFACLLLLVLCVGFAEPPLAVSENALAARLAGQHISADRPQDLETLFKLQLVAGQWREAEATIDHLVEVYLPSQLQRASALTPWRIYARSRRYEAEGSTRHQALARAFAELFASLSDVDMARAFTWYGSNMDALHQAQSSAEAACSQTAIDRCATAANVLTSRESVLAWTYLMPASQPLLRAELERRFFVQDDILIPTPDGASVAAILVRPKLAARVPSLLNFTIYARDDFALSDAVEMAAHGYAGMVAYARGKGRSPGTALPYEHDGADAATVIDWLARQSWGDRRVGMFSGSYNAFTQWAALKHHPRALMAIATHASNAPGIDTPMQGNVFENFVYPWPLYTTETSGLDEFNYNDRPRWNALNRNWYLSGRRYRDLPLIDGHPNPVFMTWLDHPSYDTYWRGLIPSGSEFARIDVPVFVETGYFDGGMVGALYYFREHLRYRPNADHRMLIGPYHHVAMTQGVLPQINGYDIDRVAQLDLRTIRMQWFDHVFRGAPLPELLSGRVNFEVMGANQWRHVDSLEAMAAGRRRFYLSGVVAGRTLSLQETPTPGDVALPVLRVDLADRSDLDAEIPASQLDTRNMLAFATTPFSQPTEIAGAFGGALDVVINKRDFDLTVELFEQKADGSYFPLSSYLARASYIQDRSARHLLTPGQPRMLAFESQTVTARRLEIGSRIVALVGVSKGPGYQINYGTGRDVSDESVGDAGAPLEIRMLRGSYLDIGFTTDSDATHSPR